MNNCIDINNKNNCCGCGLCANICPKNAITMELDEYGFEYPKIDYKKCIDCGICKRSCAYQNNDNNLKSDLNTYVAVNKNDTDLLNSSSGGVFSALARTILSNNGCVYGCSMELVDDILTPTHVRVEKEEDLIKLQGSKYVQSKMGNIYKLIKEDLNNKKIVLFSGTPCQVAAVRNFLKNVNTDNLYTIDIICHGTPSAKFFQDYLKTLEKKLKGKIIEFKFRDKANGWSLCSKVTYKSLKTGKIKTKVIPRYLSSYYTYFLNSLSYKDNCYSCKYANSKRVGDITIGDYWGIEEEHKEYLISNGGNIDEYKGVSCIIVNNDKGQKLLDIYGKNVLLKKSQYNKVSKHNGQLNNSSKPNGNRVKLLEDYKNYGYEYIDKNFNKGFQGILNNIKGIVPKDLKTKLKKLK